MQVDPIKPTLKAPGINRLKLNHDDPLSNFGFKFNLRRYRQGMRLYVARHAYGNAGTADLWAALSEVGFKP